MAIPSSRLYRQGQQEGHMGRARPFCPSVVHWDGTGWDGTPRQPFPLIIDESETSSSLVLLVNGVTENRTPC